MQEKDNLEYLEKLLGKETIERYNKVEKEEEGIEEADTAAYISVTRQLNCMHIYEDNPWWLSDNKKHKAYCQLNNSDEDGLVMLITDEEFLECLKELFGRTISMSHLYMQENNLRKEANDALYDSNKEYIRAHLGNEAVEDYEWVVEIGLDGITTKRIMNFRKIALMLKSMETYGYNRWWLSKDLKYKAYCQLNNVYENSIILLIKEDEFFAGLQQLFGRRIWYPDLFMRANSLRKEAAKIF